MYEVVTFSFDDVFKVYLALIFSSFGIYILTNVFVNAVSRWKHGN